MLWLTIQLNSAKTGKITDLSNVEIVRIADTSSGKSRYRVRVFDANWSDETQKHVRETTFLHKPKDDLFICVQKSLNALLKAGIQSKRHIPPTKYIKNGADSFDYITHELLEEYHIKEDIQRFYHFMSGQTTGVVDGKSAIYICDYERWLEKNMPYDNDVWD